MLVIECDNNPDLFIKRIQIDQNQGTFSLMKFENEEQLETQEPLD